ncbi:hypothetical protein [Metabacillus fastidiosus]|uniref:hypothetical protein n=1 Tax=Metabacillus fastidiosus TaxID=1458 RepID=UPI003D2D64E7
MSEEDKIVYKQAMMRMDELVEEVLQICDDVAEENHFERDWVLEAFRSKFNKAKRTRNK